jgi:beta-galactosidase
MTPSWAGLSAPTRTTLEIGLTTTRASLSPPTRAPCFCVSSVYHVLLTHTYLLTYFSPVCCRILDLIGLDYPCAHGPCYPEVHAWSPTIPIIASEFSSTTSDRGTYAGSPNVTISRGDGGGVPENKQSMSRSAGVWKPILTLPYVSGGFEWSGFDYKGEPVPNNWPDVNSHFGFLDIAGFLKERGYWQRIWLKQPDPPEVHFFPHWNWDTTATTAQQQSRSAQHLDPCSGLCTPGSDSAAAANVTVFAFSNAGGAVEMLLNGVSLGQKMVEEYGYMTWSVPYSPGSLEAKAYRNGSDTPVASKIIATTGPAAALNASIKDGVGAAGIVANGLGVALVQVEILDAHNRSIPTAANVVTFKVEAAEHGGPAGVEIIGTGNGNPASHTPDKSQTREAFRGLVLAVVQSTPGAVLGQKTVTISASSPGLASSSVVIPLVPASPTVLGLRL